jgi:DNA-binding transcriptional ArsR family regulator
MDAATTAKVLAALGHEGRLLVFRMLAQAGPQGLPAGEVARRAGHLQNTTSSHLSVLSHVGLVSGRREGRSIIYAVTRPRFSEALEFLTEDFFDNRNGDRAAFFQRLLDAWEDGGPGEEREADRGRNDAA